MALVPRNVSSQTVSKSHCRVREIIRFSFKICIMILFFEWFIFGFFTFSRSHCTSYLLLSVAAVASGMRRRVEYNFPVPIAKYHANIR